MSSTELFVGLKVSDNVAITAFHTLHRMGHHHLKNLERVDYYKFEFSGAKKQFEKKISQVDILINANKHKFSFSSDNNNNNYNKIKILIQNFNGSSGLLKTLKERLGLKNIKKVEKGVLWTMYFGNIIDAENVAINITKSLLMNENYQKYKIL